MINTDVLIIGAGAAGLMCAQTAGGRGKKVIVLDHADKVGKKILISGGGKCNFSNLDVSAENYISQNPHFCKSALSRFSPYDFIDLLNQYHIPFVEKKMGQLFCANSAKDIVDMLVNKCAVSQVDIRLSESINEVQKVNNVFIVSSTEQQYKTKSLVIATGGLSIPKMGATDLGYRIAKQFGLKIIATQPALVPLLLDEKLLANSKVLSGISVYAQVCCQGVCFKENILFTHKGLSGPSILQISNYWQLNDVLTINILPDMDLMQQLRDWQKQRPKAQLQTLLAEKLSKRLVKHFLTDIKADQAISLFNEKQLQQIGQTFQNWTVLPVKTQGFRIAEVTKGGVDTHEISSKTFASKQHPNLFFIGEVLDVTGWLGGYNFQWAWSSAHSAGLYV